MIKQHKGLQDEGTTRSVERNVNAKYYERGQRDDGGKAILKWVLGIVSTFIVAAVLGAWGAAERLAKLEAVADGLQRQIDRLEARIPSRYRGEPDGGLAGSH